MFPKELFDAIQIVEARHFTEGHLEKIGTIPDPKYMTAFGLYFRDVYKLFQEFCSDYTARKHDVTRDERVVLQDILNKYEWVSRTPLLLDSAYVALRVAPLLTPSIMLHVHRSVAKHTNAWTEVSCIVIVLYGNAHHLVVQIAEEILRLAQHHWTKFSQLRLHLVC